MSSSPKELRAKLHEGNRGESELNGYTYAIGKEHFVTYPSSEDEHGNISYGATEAFFYLHTPQGIQFFTVRAKALGLVQKWVQRNWQYQYEYRITITRHESENATKKQIWFNFYDSIDNWQKGITQLDENTLLYSFYLLFSDSLATEDSDFQEFCNEFGYEIDGILNLKNDYQYYKREYSSFEEFCESYGYATEYQTYTTANKAFEGCQKMNTKAHSLLAPIMEENELDLYDLASIVQECFEEIDNIL